MLSSKSTQQVPAPSRGIEAGTFQATSGEVSEFRVLVPIAQLPPGAATDLNVKLEMKPEAARIASSTIVGQHLVITIVANHRVGGAFPFKLDVNGRIIVGTLEIQHAKPRPFGVSAIVGGEATSDVPFQGQVWAKSTFTAHLEPPSPGTFRLTATKGVLEPGARFYPFKLVFTPKQPKAAVVLLVVVVNESEEFVTEVTGAAAGFQGRTWAKRSHAQLDVRPAAAGEVATGD
jgi:hypothetical protein